jgi:hypothetical protein
MIYRNPKIIRILVIVATALSATAVVYFQPDPTKLNDIPNRLPEAAPYVVAEAQAFPPPYHDHWEQEDSPGQCRTCHEKIFDEWNGSMMSNSWRDPVWRAAFLLLARATSTHGECDTPNPQDGSPKPLIIRSLTKKSAAPLSTSGAENTPFRGRARYSTSSAPAATCRRITSTMYRSKT